VFGALLLVSLSLKLDFVEILNGLDVVFLFQLKRQIDGLWNNVSAFNV
jgi:hypothetical protein